MPEAPPSTIRPAWNAVTTVEPTAKLDGSTSVWCCPSSPVNGSRESRRLTVSQLAPTASSRSATAMSRPAPQRSVSRAPS